MAPSAAQYNPALTPQMAAPNMTNHLAEKIVSNPQSRPRRGGK